MPYNDANEYAILGGAPGVDILDITPGIAGPLQRGGDALAQGAEALKGQGFNLGEFLFNPKYADNVLTGGKLQEAAQKKSGFEALLSRGIYLTIGIVLLIFGLVMLSRSATEGAIEGAIQGFKEAKEAA